MKEEILIKSWVEEARRNNNTCFNNLITYYHTDMLAYASKICRYNNIAEDALQDAYLNAFTHISSLKDTDSFANWLRTIVKRSCWQYLNINNTTLPLSSKLIDSKISDVSLGDEVEKNNLNEFLWERITHISEPLRIVLMLRYYSTNDDYKDIALILGIPVGTVRSRLNEAKKQLKKIWQCDLSEMPEKIKSDAEYWNQFYEHSFIHLQSDDSVRKMFRDHLIPRLEIKFTSGKTAYGRETIEKEIDDDIKFGTSYNLNTVFNLKDTGIIQVENINSKSTPDRCPPTSTFIFHRKVNKTMTLQMHNATPNVLREYV